MTSRCDVISYVMNIKHFLCNNLWRSFHTWCQNEVFEIFWKFQNSRHFEGRRTFQPCTGSWVLHQDRPCHCLHFERLSYRASWPSYVTFDILNLQGSLCKQTTCVDEFWWWLVKNCDLFRVTNRQTNRRTNKPPNEHTCKFFRGLHHLTANHCRKYEICEPNCIWMRNTTKYMKS